MPGGGSREESIPNASTPFQGQQDVLKHRMIDVHGRRLKLTSDSQLIDLTLRET